MPQMAPLSWLILMIFFIGIFLIFNTLNYYISENYPQSNKDKKTNKINWKW